MLPIEHCWDELGRCLRDNYELPAANLDDVAQSIQNEWNNITQETIYQLIESMPPRMTKCIEKPVRSPDMSPIDHCCDELGSCLRDNYELPAVNLDELAQMIQNEWNN